MRLIKDNPIGINLSPIISQYMPNTSLNGWEDSAADLVRTVLSKFDSPVILIPHVTFNSKNDDNDDHVFLKRVFSRISDPLKNRIGLIDPIYNAAQLKWLISQMSLFIGSRMHATIASLSSGVTTLIFTYSMKGRGIFQDIFNKEEWTIDADEISTQLVCMKLKELDKSKNETKDYLNRILPALRSKASAAAVDLRRIVEELTL
jgi:polysaccharide pyruvyl transferase WcaK-like protein